MNAAALVAALAVASGGPLGFDGTWQSVVRGTAFQGLTGPVTVTFGAADGEPTATLSSEVTEYRGVLLGALTVELTQPRDAGPTVGTARLVTELAERVEAEFELDLKVGPLLKGLRWGRQRLEAVIVAKGVDLGRLTQRLPALAVTGKADLLLSLAGSPRAPELHGHLSATEVAWRGDPVGELTFRWEHANGRNELHGRWGPSEGPGATWAIEAPMRINLGAATVQWMPQERHSLEVELRGLTERELRPLWVAPPSVRLTLDGRLSAAGDQDEHTASLELSGGLTGKGGRTLPWNLTARADPLTQSGRLSIARGGDETGAAGAGVVSAEIAASADTVGILRGAAWLQEAPFEADVHVDLPLQTLAPFVPAGIYDPVGRIVGQLRAGGTLGHPSASGAFGADDAALTLLGVNQRLSGLKLSARVEGTTVIVEELSATAGLGRIHGSLRSTWTPTPSYAPDEAGLWAFAQTESEGSARLERFPLVQDGVDIGAVDAALSLRSVSEPDESRVTVEIAEAEVELTGGRLPRVETIPSNDQVRIQGWVRGVLGGGHGPDEDQRLILDVSVADRIEVSGPDAQLSVGGRLQLLLAEGEAVVSGGFRLIPGGQITLLDTPFRLRGGILTLAPGALPTRPVVELDARAQVVGTYIALKLRGPASRPELILAASPGLPEYQIITLLLTGRVDAVDDEDGDVRRKVEELVSRFHSPGLQQQLFDRLGIDKLKVKFKSLAQPMLTVGKQLDRQWYVESVYRHNSEPDENEKEGRVQYRLDPRWTLDTTYGDAGEGTLGAFWRHRFGGPPPPTPPEGWADDL